MARYIDADKFKSHLEKAMERMHLIGGVKAVDVGAVITALDRQTTADVAPKSEVAREIFAEIEKYASCETTLFNVATYSIGVSTFAILKKKYIGEQNK